MKYVLIILILVFVQGCAQPIVDPTFAPYVSVYQDSIKIDVSGVGITFGDLSLPVIGICRPDNNTITIDSTWFAKASEPYREMLVFHELSHCLLHVGHDTTILPDGCPESVMYPYIVQTPCYAKHRAEYIEQLKHVKEVEEQND